MERMSETAEETSCLYGGRKFDHVRTMGADDIVAIVCLCMLIRKHGLESYKRQKALGICVE